MNRTEFVIVTALILFVAFALGWATNWLVHRFTRVRQSDLSELDRMAQALHEAELIRDQAIEYVETRERDLTSRLSQAEAELQRRHERIARGAGRGRILPRPGAGF
jgi:prophage endopeptidase